MSNETNGSVVHKRIIADAKAQAGKTRAQIDVTGCFIAGTLVHTREGLVPIEQIKVGDWVLSKPESGE
ncbi:MAG: Hint domain-containing protein [Betaproteobacteria bacterium]|nr:Hint domain-containing protein [Betaproteobacteria bacterium]